MVSNQIFYKKWSESLIHKDYSFKENIKNFTILYIKIC